MNTEIIGYDRASILDLTIASYGDIQSAMAFCADNGISITDTIIIDYPYKLHESNQRSLQLLQKIREERIKPATEISEAEMAACPYGGIGEMGIEIDFIVS